MKKIVKILFVTLGITTFVLGTIGIILPALPTTPLYLLTCFLFAKGSTRFHGWFIGTKLYKNHLEAFVSTRAMTLKMKLRIILTAGIFMTFAFVLVPSQIVRIIIVCALVFMWCYFAFRIKTIPQDNSD